MSQKCTVVAVYPQKDEFRIFDDMPPLGMAWIAAVLRADGIEVIFIDQQVDATDVASLVETQKPAFVLLGGTSHTRFEAFSLAAAAKKAYGETTVIFGGPHASFTAHNTLTRIGDIDFVVHGEGEFPTLDLIHWKLAGANPGELEKISGISFRKDTQVVSTGWRPYMKNLDLLPEPARDLLPMKKYRMNLEYLELPATSIITARGCPVNCSYCSASRMFGKSYALRSIPLVVDEIEHLVRDYGIKGLKIFDSTFTLNKNHVLEFCATLKKRGLVMPWECEVRVGSVDKQLLSEMKSAGCYYVDVGIESGDQFVLDTMGKHISAEAAHDFLKMAHEVGVWTKAFFTIGHIGESYTAGKKTVRFIRKNQRYIKLIGMSHGIRIYPGTQVEDFAQEHNLMPAGFEWSRPYQNNDNLKIFKPVDNVPILLQPQMGISLLRKLRIRYGIMRVLSPGYLLFKTMHLIRYGQIGKFLSMLFTSLFKRK